MGTNNQCHPFSTTCHCTMCYTTTHYPPPPQHYPHQMHQYPPPQHYPHQIHQYPPPQHYPHQHPPPQHYPHQIHQHPPPQHYPHQHPPPQNQQNTLNPALSTLIHRVSALESSLRLRRRKQSTSLRDAAARTIQTHFRAYLVRRSVTLRHLKHLALIKSALNRLKSSVSSKTHFDPHTISRESMSLLLKLDSIQGSDPMIRDGKRSISRELIQFMELIDEMCRAKQAKIVNFKKCINQVDVRNGPREGVSGKKNVSFDENGNVYRLFKSRVSSDNSSRDDEEVEVEEIGVSLKDTEVEADDDSSEMSGNEMDPRKNLRTRVHRRIKKNQPDQEEDDNDDDDDSFVFSAPLPAKMEY